MKTEFYLPLLKAKAGEFEGLSKLDSKLKKKIVPFFEVTPNEYDHDTGKKPKTLEEHLTNFSKKIIQKWPDSECFIDTELINNEDINGIECIEYIYSKLGVRKVYPSPVVSLSLNEYHIESINRIRDFYHIEELGIRITLDNIGAGDFTEKLNDLLDLLQIDSENCHIILDLKSSDFSNKEDFADAIIDEINGLPHLHFWRSFTLVGGAFPSMGNVKTTTLTVPRNDWKFYNYFINELRKKSFFRPINYGDYSIVSPKYFKFDPKIMKSSANIRYTHNDVWYVAKGGALAESDDWKQFFKLAKQIVDSSYFLGEKFSFGDLRIKRCSEKRTTTGNANTWMGVGNNHHFTKVINDLFAKNL